MTDTTTKLFFLSLFDAINYDNLSDNVLEFLYDYLYILKQYQILLNSFFASTGYRNCSIQIEKSSYINDISNLILNLNTVINEINIEKNYLLSNDESNSLIVYQQNIYDWNFLRLISFLKKYKSKCWSLLKWKCILDFIEFIFRYYY